MPYHFKNLVFEGGGVRGIAYIGALKALDQKGVLRNIARVGGTSAGAITAVLVGLNYSLKQVEDILWSVDFKRFMDDSWGVIRDSQRLIDKFGWYKGDFFREWIGKIIAKKVGNPNATFADIEGNGSFRKMHFIGTNLSTGFAEVFSFEHTPRICIADAARISMSIPLFFAAVRNQRNDVYVDGGMLDNYPIKLFDREKYQTQHFLEPDYYKRHNAALKRKRVNVSKYVYNMETLGFRLDTAKEIAVFRDQAEPPRYPVDDFFDYTKALFRTLIGFQSSLHIHSDDWQRTVYIDTLDIESTDFDLSDKKKQSLVDSGENMTKEYFKWFDSKKSSPVNRP